MLWNEPIKHFAFKISCKFWAYPQLSSPALLSEAAVDNGGCYKASGELSALEIMSHSRFVAHTIRNPSCEPVPIPSYFFFNTFVSALIF